jgi:AcrR family transcriptional regulator
MCAPYTFAALCVKVYSVRMPYPSKTDRQTILSAAVKQLTHSGIRDLSLRNLAASLDLAPNAIYRYFSDRPALEAALAGEAARQMELALKRAADGRGRIAAIREMSAAYIKFAKDNRYLYDVMMSPHVPKHDAIQHQSLWAFTVEQVERIAGPGLAAQASVALWAFLHGAVALEAAEVFGENKPASGIGFGLDAWFMAVSTTKPTKGKAKKKASVRENPARRRALRGHEIPG